MAYLLLLMWIVVIVGESKLSGIVCSGLLGKAFVVLAFPGIFVHEVSHMLGCLIMGAKVTNFSLFEPQGGYVTHGEPKIPIIGKPVISFAPLFGCGLALWFVYSNMPIQPDIMSEPKEAFNLLRIDFTGTGLQEFALAVFAVVKHFFVSIPTLDFASGWTYLFAYLALSLGIAFSPSKQDFLNAVVSLVICVTLLFVADIIAVATGKGRGLEPYVLAAVVPLLSFALGMMTFLLAVSGVFWALHKLVDVVMRSETTGKGGRGGEKGKKGGKAEKPEKPEKD
jgi:membrane protein implicated in regulation of membrane protease activity